MSNDVTKSTMPEEIVTKAEFTTITDRKGTHIKVYLKEFSKEKDEFIDDIGVVTYHVTTHSITLGEKIKKGYTETELALLFTDMLKDKEFRDFIKKTAEIKNVPYRPVWCKQLNKHFR